MQATTLQRPSFKASHIDYTDKDVQRLIKDYINWSDSDEGTDEEYIEDIKLIFGEIEYYGIHVVDGYKLAKYLEDKVYLIADSMLVDILDSAPDIAYRHYDKALKDWVKNNDLVIPDDVYGKTIESTTSFKYKKFVGQNVVGIRPEKYEVVVNANPHLIGGTIIPFEDLILANETEQIA
jgi:hypothetical protein